MTFIFNRDTEILRHWNLWRSSGRQVTFKKSGGFGRGWGKNLTTGPFSLSLFLDFILVLAYDSCLNNWTCTSYRFATFGTSTDDLFLLLSTDDPLLVYFQNTLLWVELNHDRIRNNQTPPGYTFSLSRGAQKKMPAWPLLVVFILWDDGESS